MSSLRNGAPPLMSAQNLPKRIATLMVVAILCFLLALGGLVQSIRLGMDEQARDGSVRLVGNRIKAMQAALAATAQDFAIWGTAYGHVMARDFDWIYDNFAISAISGDLFDGVVLSGGTLIRPAAWVEGGPAAAGDTFLTKQMAMQIAVRVAAQDPTDSQTENFVMLLDGQATLVTALQVKPDDPQRRIGLDPLTLPQAVLTQRLSPVDLERIAIELTLTALRFVPEPVVGLPNFALDGIQGTPVVYLVWDPPRPGTQLVETMWPVLLLVALAFAGLAGGGAMLMRRYARQLVLSEQAATRLARQDSMTGLPNRLGFIEHLRRVEQAGIGKIAVLFMDINGFKKINDTMGHDCGDSVVREFAERMRGLATPDVFFARVGGDEFVFVLHVAGDVAARLGQLNLAIATRMIAPCTIGGTEVFVSVSQGYAIKDAPEQSTSELLRRADLAMYHAKRSNLGMVMAYQPEMDQTTHLQNRIAQALQLALTRPDQFECRYQPMVDARSGLMLQAEVQVHWHSPDMGLLDAATFVPVAEATGLIGPLGWMLLELIAADLTQVPGLRVSINFSPHHLDLPQFAAQVQNRLAHYRIAPGRITVELPETGLNVMADKVGHQLDLLHQAGLSSVLDHLGRGMSSINCLRQMPFAALKIDAGLTGAAVLTDQGAHLIRAIVHLGQALGQRVICDGIETADQAKAVMDLGCDVLQGGHIGAALPLAGLLDLYPDLDCRSPRAA